MLLQDYIFRLQRLLHDAQAQTFPVTPDLTTYVNIARDRVALDTLATRVLPTITVNPFQERYNHAVVQQATLTLAWTATGGPPPSRNIGAIMNLNYIQSTAYQPPLNRMAWTDFNLKFRQTGPEQPSAIPSAWAPYSDNQNFYIAPVVGTATQLEVDCIYLPLPLVNLNDAETAIADPLSELVPLMAARWAMYYMDEQDTAAAFWAHYKLERDELAATLPSFAGFSQD
jgi:hypothetical protein